MLEQIVGDITEAASEKFVWSLLKFSLWSRFRCRQPCSYVREVNYWTSAVHFSPIFYDFCCIAVGEQEE